MHQQYYMKSVHMYYMNGTSVQYYKDCMLNTRTVYMYFGIGNVFNTWQRLRIKVIAAGLNYSYNYGLCELVKWLFCSKIASYIMNIKFKDSSQMKGHAY